MKRVFFSLLLLSIPTFAGKTGPSAEIAIIDKLFVPDGYDDNDMIEVVVAGTFPDSCHQVGEAITRIDESTKTVSIMQLSYREPGVMCVQMTSTFSHTIKIGHLKQGHYNFRVLNNPEISRQLTIKHADVDGTDDFLYPPVEFADVVHSQDGKPVLVVKGNYPLMKKGCMKTTDAIIHYQSNDTLVVQPKAVIMDETEQGCESKYEERYELHDSLAGKFLIHVRALNGQSYNRVEQN